MKRILATILALVLIIGLCPTVAFAEDVTEISTVADLLKIAENPNGHFVLTNDIKISYQEYQEDSHAQYPLCYYPIGIRYIKSGAEKPTAFTGVLDGNGYEISNLMILYYPDQMVPYEYLGFIAHNKGTIKNLSIKISFKHGYLYQTPKTAYVGGLVGYNEGVIENCSVKASDFKVGAYKNTTMYMGGIAGFNKAGGVIENCYYTGKLDAVSAALPAERGDEADAVYFGGITGQNNGTVKTSLSLAAATFTSEQTNFAALGDGIGVNKGTLLGVYAKSSHKIPVGRNSGTESNVASLTADKLVQKENFIGFDFEKIWVMEPEYPALRIAHKHKNAWSCTPEGHKQSCYSCKEVQNEGAHSDENGDGVCEICGLNPSVPAPVITVQPVSVKQYSDKIATFTVTATGENLKYKWYYASSDTAVVKHIYSYGLDTGVDTRQLSFPADHGGYPTIAFYCVVSNAGGEARSQTVVLTSLENVYQIFSDVKQKDWFYKNNSINYVYNEGLFTGTSQTTFSPNAPMTRGMFVTVLGRLHGVSVNHRVKTAFTDVKKGQYYTGYVQWANKAGIVNGVSKTSFAPNANITREQICKMMAEYCSFAGIELSKTGKSITFKDASKISRWAKKYVTTCQTAGLVNGEKKDGIYYFRPQGNATRAEVATIIYNFAKKYK